MDECGLGRGCQSALLVFRLQLREHRDFQRHQRAPGIAVATSSPRGRRRRRRSAMFSLPNPRSLSAMARRISARMSSSRQRRELEDLAPADQRRVDREKRILRRRADQQDQYPASTSAAECPAGRG